MIVYHFMFGPGWEEGCPSCSFLADHFEGSLVHLANRDVSFVVVSRAPLAQIEAFKKRMGWRFKWVSSFGNDFNYDYNVSFTKDDIAAAQDVLQLPESRVSPEKKPRAPAYFIKTPVEASFTPTPRTGAAWTSGGRLQLP